MSKPDGDAVKDATSLPPESISLDITPNVKDATISQPRPVAPAPDGGIAGWLVLVSAFSISMLVDGVCFSFGIFFDDFREEFHTSKATTSWIGSVLNGSYLIFGPMVSILVNLYGCRKVAMSGAVMASASFFVSTWSTNIGLLIFTYGFLGGVGFGLMYLPSIVIVGYYFEKRRALATGIACCGSGIGAFLFAPFTEYLLEQYGWRGGLWILSALVLNGFLFGIFYRPLPQATTNKGGNSTPDAATSSPSQASNVVMSTTPNDRGVSEGSSMLVADLSLTVISEGDAKKKMAMPDPKDNALDLPTSLYRTRSVTLHGPDFQEYHTTSPNKGALLRLTQSQDLAALTTRKKQPTPKALVVSPLQRKDIFYSGSLMHLKEMAELNGSLEDYRKFMLTSSQEIPTTCDDTMTQPTQTTLSQAFVNLFDFSLLKSPTFVIYGLSCFFCMAGFFVPFIYMPTHAMDMGYGGTKGAFLISIIGITNTVGRVAVGFISDQPWADCLLINNVALAIGGVATIFVPYYNHYFILAIYAAVFGSSIAVFVSLRSIIMVELLGIEKLTTAFGLVIMCQGMSSFLGAPIAGALSDATDNYDASFYMAGITLTLSGLICLPLRRVARWEQARKTRSAHRSSNKLLNAGASCKGQYDGATRMTRTSENATRLRT